MCIFITREDFYPKPPLLNLSEIKSIEEFLDIDFPDTTEKIYTYFQYYDRGHLYAHFVFKNEELNEFQEQFSGYLGPETITLEIGDEEPLRYEYANPFARGGGYILPWWNPHGNLVRYHQHEVIEDSIDYETIIMLEVQIDYIGVYIIRHCWYPAFPEEIRSIYSFKPNWDLRESKLYPLLKKEEE